MKKLGVNLLCVGILLVGTLAVNVSANPLPSCSDEWCRFTEPNIVYIDFEGFALPSSMRKEENAWMSKNCPNWPELDEPLYRALPYFVDQIRWDYRDAVNALWEKSHPKDRGIDRSEQQKLREEQYLAAQKEKYGRNIPYCLTEKAQDRVQQERRETEKYLHDAQNVPMVRDRLAMLAKIEEANAKTAKELGLKNLYKSTPKWQIDKATLEAWWAETHPNGKALDAQAIKQRYKDYFAKREWKEAHPNEPEPSIEEMKQQNEDAKLRAKENHENELKNWWNENCAYEPEQNYFEYMSSAHYHYNRDVNELWLSYHPTERKRCMNCDNNFSVPFEEREKFYRSKQQELYGKQVPYCLAQSERKALEKQKQELQREIDDYEGHIQRRLDEINRGALKSQFKNFKYFSPETQGKIIYDTAEQKAKSDERNERLNRHDQEEIDRRTPNLLGIQRTIDATSQIAEKLGLDLNLELDPLRDPSVSFPTEEEKQVSGNMGLEELQQLKQKLQQITTGDELNAKIHKMRKEEERNQQIIKTAPFVYLFLVGLIALGIVAGAAIILLRRKKNLPK